MGSGYSPGIKTERDDGSELLSGLTGLDSPARAGGALRAPVAATLLEALQGVKNETGALGREHVEIEQQQQPQLIHYCADTPLHLLKF
jgi:hypothetical protein